MKKLLFFVVATATLLIGCKKDDNGPKFPVADLNLPESSAENPTPAGSDVMIQGKGFTQSSEIWLRALTKTDNADVQATVTEVTATAIIFKAPVVSGERAVILKQEGEEWTLGTMHFSSANEILPRKLVRLIKTYSEAGEEDETVTRLLAYDAQGRISSISDQDDADDITRITYTENEVTVQGIDAKQAYRLENGRAVSSEWTANDNTQRGETAYTYDTGNFLCKIVEKSYDAGSETPYTYTSNRTFLQNSLVKITGESEKRNEYVDITPNESLRNNLGFNLCTYLVVESIDHDENVMPYLLGITGTRSIYLPETCNSTYEIPGADADAEGTRGSYTCTFEYNTDEEGYITEIRLESTGGWSTLYELYYEE